MINYKLCLDSSGDEYGAIRTNENGSFTMFFFNESCPNYQQYLAWLAEGNEPEPADEQ